MKYLIVTLTSFLLVNFSFADSYEFQVHRFCDIQLTTTLGKEEVQIKVYPKAVDETEVIYKSKLTKKGERYFTTDAGISFILTKLPDALINDHNRGVNSGNWLLVIVGESKGYLALKKKLDAISTFRHDYLKFPPAKAEKNMSDMSYLGIQQTKENSQHNESNKNVESQ